MGHSLVSLRPTIAEKKLLLKASGDIGLIVQQT